MGWGGVAQMSACGVGWGSKRACVGWGGVANECVWGGVGFRVVD